MWNLIFKVVSFFRRQKLNTDSFTSKLVYQFLSAFLLFSSAFLFFNNTYGSKMQCYASGITFSKKMSKICWSKGTYVYGKTDDDRLFAAKSKATSTGVFEEYDTTVDVAPGIRMRGDRPPEVVHHFLYFYLPFVYIVEALLCRIGRYLWTRLQGRTLSNIVHNLDNPKLDEFKARELQIESAQMFFDGIRIHKRFANSYTLVLVENILVLVAQYLIILLFTNRDWKFGVSALQWVFKPYKTWPLSLARIFPHVTVCERYSFGVGGNMQMHDALCFLTANRANLIIFATHWWLVVVLLFLTLCELADHIWKKCRKNNRVRHITCVLNINSDSEVAGFIENLNYGSMFVISLLCKNIPKDFVSNILLHIKDLREASELTAL